MKRKAFVLIITLGMIAIITAIVLENVSLSKSSLDDLSQIKEQNELLYLMGDFTAMIESFSSQNVDNIKKFLTSQDMPISDEKSGLNLVISCSALDQKLNLNRVVACNKASCAEAIKGYAKEKGLVDSEFFLALLKDTVKPTSIERMGGSSLAMDDKTFQTGCVESFSTIEKLKQRYYQQTQDNNIFKVTKEDFSKVFYLSSLKLKDNNDSFPSDETAKSIGCYENDDNCKEKFHNIINLSLKNNFTCSKQENNQTIQTKNLLQCNIKLFKGDTFHSITFKYNLDKKSKKKIVSVDEFF